jgi:hypothetical protein
MGRHERASQRRAEREARSVARAERKAKLEEVARWNTPIMDYDRMPVLMQDVYHGAKAVLVCGGPSLKTLELSQLRRRGVTVVSFNNGGCNVHPNVWTHGDPAQKFHSSLWRDPTIMKFVPHAKLGNCLRSRQPDGTLAYTDERSDRMPNVWGINRGKNFDPNLWLSEPRINWGNSKKDADKNGFPSVYSTMIQAMKLSYWLGFRTLYLLGCDFRMRHTGDIYTHSDWQSGAGDEEYEKKRREKIDGNNQSYAKIAYLFRLLVPKFAEAGFEVLNCNPESGLKVFPFCGYNEAVEACVEGIEEIPDCRGYDSKEPKRGR